MENTSKIVQEVLELMKNGTKPTRIEDGKYIEGISLREVLYKHRPIKLNTKL